MRSLWTLRGTLPTDAPVFGVHSSQLKDLPGMSQRYLGVVNTATVESVSVFVSSVNTNMDVAIAIVPEEWLNIANLTVGYDDIASLPQALVIPYRTSMSVGLPPAQLLTWPLDVPVSSSLIGIMPGLFHPSIAVAFRPVSGASTLAGPVQVAITMDAKVTGRGLWGYRLA
jgi:hypothetical protein